jgi:hypothetical protein
MNVKRTPAKLVVLALLASSIPAFGQRRLEFQFGARVGVPVTKFMESDLPTMIFIRETFDRTMVTAGPTFGAIIHDRFLIQLDAMYKRVRGRQQGTNPGAAIFEFRAASFEFPVIVDYYFTRGRWRPYAGVGVVAGHISTGTLDSRFPPGSGAGELDTPFSGQLLLRKQLPAYVANGGLEWNISDLAIRPEVRYTRWNESHGVGVPVNQLEVSVGFSLDPSR